MLRWSSFHMGSETRWLVACKGSRSGTEWGGPTGVIVFVAVRLSLLIGGGLVSRLVALIASLVGAAAPYVGLS